MTVENPKTRINHLRATVGDFGIALFAPLLDFVPHDQSGHATDPTISRTSCFHAKSSITSSSGTTCTLQTEPESDCYCSEEDDYDGIDDSDALVANDDNSFDSIRIVAECQMQLRACPRILSEDQMQYLRQYLPHSIRDNVWDRRFMIGVHGDSFCTLLRKCAGFKHSIVVVRSVSGHILGGYASEEWRIRDELKHNTWSRNDEGSVFKSTRHAYFGTGQSFVFGSHPISSFVDPDMCANCESNHNVESASLCVYPWTGQNDYCQICDADRSVLCMGGDGEFGWIVSDNFTTGQTGFCSTYNNPPLVHPSTFQVADFEIYVLASPIFGF
jgi:TLD